MAGVDVVVMGSTWYENAPMVIQEAFVYGRLIGATAGGNGGEGKQTCPDCYLNLVMLLIWRDFCGAVAKSPELSLCSCKGELCIRPCRAKSA